MKKHYNSRAISELLPKQMISKLCRHYFPKISRFITERKLFIWLFSLIILSFCILVSFVFLQAAMEHYKRAVAKKQGIEKQLTYWQGVVKKYPDYRDGYVMIAGLEYQLGDSTQSSMDFEHAQKLDPNNHTLERMGESIKY